MKGRAAIVAAMALAGCASNDGGGAGAPSPAVSPQAEGIAPAGDTTLSRTEVMEAQALLQRLGYGPEEVDGIVGPSSHAAAAAYRARERRSGGGTFDAALLSDLRRSAEARGVATIAAPPPVRGG